MSLLSLKTLNEYRLSLAQYLPNGIAWIAKNDPTKNLYKLLYGLAYTMLSTDNELNNIVDEHDIENTEDFLDEWESAVGIPDDCISKDYPDDQRRRNILTKMLMPAVVTEDDFIEIASIFGYQVSIIQAGGERATFPYTFPIYFWGTMKKARFTMIVQLEASKQPNIFPYTFPITFDENFSNLLECLFNKLKPANTVVKYEYVL